MTAKKLTAEYTVSENERLVGILKKLQEYQVNYKVIKVSKPSVIRCIDMDVGQQNIVSGMKKIFKKV